MNRPSCILIYNKNASRSLDDKNVENLLNYIERVGYNPEIIFSKDENTVKDKIFNNYILSDQDILVSIGGDGTFSRLLNSATDCNTILAHIPFGTTNDIGNMFGIRPSNPINILNSLFNGEVKEIDFPNINGTPYAYTAAAGKLTDIPYITSKKLKQKYGHFAYILMGAKDFFKNDIKPIYFKLEYEDKQLYGEAGIIAVSNSNGMAGISNLFKSAIIDDEKFEITILPLKSKVDLFKSMLYAGFNDIKNIDGIISFSTNKATFKFNNTIDIDVDGDLYKGNTITSNFTIGKKKVLVPKYRKPDLFKK